MEALIQFFSSIGNAIVMAFNFLFSAIKDIVYVIALTTETVRNIPVYFSWIPPQVMVIIVTLFSIVVIYKILGREG